MGEVDFAPGQTSQACREVIDGGVTYGVLSMEGYIFGNWPAVTPAVWVFERLKNKMTSESIIVQYPQ